MEKEIRQFEIPYDLSWQYEVEISKIRKDLDEIEKLGATHVLIDSYISYDISFVSINAVCERLETDDDFAKRINEEETRKEDIKRTEIEYYNKIKEKYNL